MNHHSDTPGFEGGDQDQDHPQQPASKRSRKRPSCLECRRRKVSCDRAHPCRRCINSETLSRCVYKTPNGGIIRACDYIQKLKLENAQLKKALNQGCTSFDSSIIAASNSPATQKDDAGTEAIPQREVQQCIDASTALGDTGGGLWPLMRETAGECLRPINVYECKDRILRREEREIMFAQPDLELEALLPAKLEVDALISVYLSQFEQVHRIVHIPTFKREYREYWEPNSKKRYAAFTALILSMIAVSSCVHTHPRLGFIDMMSDARHWAENWTRACADWYAEQSQKHQRLIHYQVACLLYLGEQVNTIKERLWTDSGALIRYGIVVGLHREPSNMAGKIDVYNQEMRRRIWTTIQEFDVQASFDRSLPALLSQLHYDTNAPRNLDDEDFDEDTTQLPPSKPVGVYNFSSFQYLARQSLPLRLKHSQLLTDPTSHIDYVQVIQISNSLIQKIMALPSWDMNMDNSASAKKPLIAYTLLHVQLRQYLIPLHQPYMKMCREHSKYQHSETIYYNAARDIVLLHDNLYQRGIRVLNVLCEHALTAATNLYSVTMLQPRDSTNMIMTNSQRTLKLLEKCLAMKEDRLLRCGNDETGDYKNMCAALGLLEAHLGTKTTEAAKSSSADRVNSLHHKLLVNQEAQISDRPTPVAPLVPSLTASNAGHPGQPHIMDRQKACSLSTYSKDYWLRFCP